MQVSLNGLNTCSTRLGSRSVHDTDSVNSELSSINMMEVEALFSSASNIFRADRIREIGCDTDGDTSRRLESRRDKVRMSSMIRF